MKVTVTIHLKSEIDPEKLATMLGEALNEASSKISVAAETRNSAGHRTMRAYAIQTYSQEENIREILSIVSDLLNKKLKSPKYGHKIKATRSVPVSEIYRVVQSRTKLKKRMALSSSGQSYQQAIEAALDQLIRDRVLAPYKLGKGRAIRMVREPS